jgi:pyruvate ferredoxin oxidoreductase alpha subunit
VLKQIEGSRAVAEAVAMCRPQVICAYPITPQTHIVEALGALVKKGQLNAGFMNVESEFAAMSAVIGASAAGARAYTATASQGLLYMSEAVYNAAGLGLPVAGSSCTPRPTRKRPTCTSRRSGSRRSCPTR